LNCLLSVVFVTHGDRIEVVKRFLQSVNPHNAEKWLEFICVDNGSNPSSSDYILGNFGFVHVITNEENRGTSRAFNEGLKQAKGDYVLILNDDTVMPEGMLDRLRVYLSENPECDGIALGLKRNSTTNQAIRLKIVNISKIHPTKPTRATFIGTGNLLIRRSIIENLGFYDENYFAGNEDMDLSYRLKKAGIRIYYLPEFYIYHLHVYRHRKTHWTEVLLARRLSDIYFAQKFYPAFAFVTRIYALKNFKKRVGMVIDADTFKKAKGILFTKRDSYYEIQKSLVKNGIDVTYRRYIINEV
jgi:GT2 family glycosyltransferase